MTRNLSQSQNPVGSSAADWRAHSFQWWKPDSMAENPCDKFPKPPLPTMLYGTKYCMCMNKSWLHMKLWLVSTRSKEERQTVRNNFWMSSGVCGELAIWLLLRQSKKMSGPSSLLATTAAASEAWGVMPRGCKALVEHLWEDESQQERQGLSKSHSVESEL